MFRTVALLSVVIGLVLVAPASRRAVSEEAKQAPAKEARTPDVVYVPTPHDVVDKMLEMARGEERGRGLRPRLRRRADRGGRRQEGGQGQRLRHRPERVEEAKANVKKNKVEKSAKIFEEDIFTLDLSKANVITLYLLPRLNVKLIPQLEKLKPGSRIVSHDFDMEGVKPDREVKMTSQEDGREPHDLSLDRAAEEGSGEEVAGQPATRLERQKSLA